ncbi:MAG: RlmE family RNA methyltransferase [Gammaproteobacteria bacterium]|nr:RlmE family RNA methyltransferase [Gammaproteobacteria bacterium]MCY4275423.1 RlmE family RNA methyltransferase [Gammaproteobacteria bacterium]
MKKLLGVVLSRNRIKSKSRAWIRNQNRDQYVREARAQGLRARSAYKLKEIDYKHQLIKPYYQVVDLGAAPGGWSKYVSTILSEQGLIVGVDLLEMRPIHGVIIIQGDFTESSIQEKIIDQFESRLLDLVLSDMSPNISGIATIDQAKAERMHISILEFCAKALKPGGVMLVKLFEGSSSSDIKKMYSENFNQIFAIKPKASRSESREVYLLAKGYMM